MFRGAKDGLSGGESLAFAVQKTVFWKVKHICFAVKGEWKGSGRGVEGEWRGR